MKQFLCLVLGLLFCWNPSRIVAQEKPKRENIEWLDVWMPKTNDIGLPRVLLIGNSITRQYYKDVEKQLEQKAFVARLSTSKSIGDPGLLQEVALILGYYKFDVVHFNNGMHGWDYSEQEYKKAFPDLYKTIRQYAPDAKLIWANTTPVRTGERMEKYDSRNERVKERNRIAYEYLKDKDVQINDLYSVAANNTVFYGGNDGVHLQPLGVKVLANQVADQIREALGENLDLSCFPEGFKPKEIGAKLGRHFIPGKHFLHGGKWIHYAEVCTWLGALRYAQVANDKELIDLLKERFEPLFTTEKAYQPIKNHVDLNMFGCLPLEFYQVTKDRKYYDLGMPYADTQWFVPVDAKPEEKNYAKKGFSWQTRLWIDDMYMITIVQAEAYHVTGDKKYINRAAKEMVLYLDEIQRENGLFYHAPDVPFYWGRGDGWMAVGMTELLFNLPENDPNRQRILKGYRLMMENLKKYVNEDGLWNQLIDEKDCWTETSGSAMFTYAMILGVKNGWLDKDEYGPIARRAWLGLCNYLDDNNDLMEVCIGTGKKNSHQYYLDRPRITGDYHGQAPIIWCAYALLSE